MSLVTKWLNFEWVCGSVWTAEVAVCGYLMVTSSTCQDCESVWDVSVSWRGCSMCLMFYCKVDMENKVATWYCRPSCLFVCLFGRVNVSTGSSKLPVTCRHSVVTAPTLWLSHACCEPRPTQMASDLACPGRAHPSGFTGVCGWGCWCFDGQLSVMLRENDTGEGTSLNTPAVCLLEQRRWIHAHRGNKATRSLRFVLFLNFSDVKLITQLHF